MLASSAARAALRWVPARSPGVSAQPGAPIGSCGGTRRLCGSCQAPPRPARPGPAGSTSRRCLLPRAATATGARQPPGPGCQRHGGSASPRPAGAARSAVGLGVSPRSPLDPRLGSDPRSGGGQRAGDRQWSVRPLGCLNITHDLASASVIRMDPAWHPFPAGKTHGGKEWGQESYAQIYAQLSRSLHAAKLHLCAPKTTEQQWQNSILKATEYICTII